MKSFLQFIGVAFGCFALILGLFWSTKLLPHQQESTVSLEDQCHAIGGEWYFSHEGDTTIDQCVWKWNKIQ